MKKLEDLFNELGFDKKAKEETKKAFVKNLIKAAKQHEQQAPKPAPKSKPNKRVS